MAKILREKKVVVAGGAGVIESCTVILPENCTLRRVEAFITSIPTAYPDAATGFLDEVFLQHYPLAGEESAHLISQEPLIGRGIVAWDGEIKITSMMAITGWFSDLTAGNVIEVVAVID